MREIWVAAPAKSNRQRAQFPAAWLARRYRNWHARSIAAVAAIINAVTLTAATRSPKGLRLALDHQAPTDLAKSMAVSPLQGDHFALTPYFVCR